MSRFRVHVTRVGGRKVVECEKMEHVKRVVEAESAAESTLVAIVVLRGRDSVYIQSKRIDGTWGSVGELRGR